MKKKYYITLILIFTLSLIAFKINQRNHITDLEMRIMLLEDTQNQMEYRANALENSIADKNDEWRLYYIAAFKN